MRRGLLFAVLAAGACVASAKPLGFAKLNEISKSGDRNYVFIIAHRGITVPAERIPENSVAAAKRAIELGADIIEVDPKTTKDNRVILLHEYRNLDIIMKFECGGVDGNATFRDIPYESANPAQPCFKTAWLRTSREDPTPTDQHPCTWEELLDVCKGKCFIHADCSYWNGAPDYRLLWDPIVARGMQDQVLFNVEKGSGAYIMAPGSPTPEGMRGFFWDGVMWEAGKSAPVETLEKLLAADANGEGRRIGMLPIGMYGHNLAGDWGDRASIDVDPRVGWGKLLDLGATVLMTDYPDELRKYLEKSGRRAPKPYAKRRRVIPEQVPNAVYDGSTPAGLQSRKVKLAQPDACWCDGTTGEKTIWWNVALPKSGFRGGSLFAYLANDGRRVDASPAATGGDIVLKYVETGKDRYIHVFTNGTATIEFKKPVTARVLAVGGGGGAGLNMKKGGPWDFQPGGGGNGGAVVDRTGVRMSGSYTVTVGKGGAPQKNGGSSSVAHGKKQVVSSRGGAAGVNGRSGALGKSGDGAEEKGKPGFHARGSFPGGGKGRFCDIFRERLWFGGGGAAGSHGENGSGTYKILGGLGGGGTSSSDSYNGRNHYAEPGTDGLGGGGAGGQMRGTDANLSGCRGGDGIVVISY